MSSGSSGISSADIAFQVRQEAERAVNMLRNSFDAKLDTQMKIINDLQVIL